MSTNDSAQPGTTRYRTIDVSEANDAALWRTRCWLEHAVIGLNLCPFARPVHRQGHLWLALSDARDESRLLTDLQGELNYLLQADPILVGSVILIHPFALNDFYVFNDFLGIADQYLSERGLSSECQIASFHPMYQFAGTRWTDVTNNSNRSPFPMLHLLRESSVSKAVDIHPDTNQISPVNQQVLTELGEAGWAELRRQWDKL